MTHRPRRPLPLVAAMLVALSVAACGGTTTSASPSSATPTPSTPTPSAAPTATAAPPTPTVAPATASPTPTPTPTAAAACAITPQTGRLPSDRMTNVQVSTSPSADIITFVFGNMSVPEPPQGASEGSLEAAVPPYTQAASGATIDVTGDHVAQIRFSGMSLSNDAGEPTYDGTMDFRPRLPALKTLVNYDMSEGIVGWYVGYDGNGCITLTTDGSNVIVAIGHPAS